MMKMAMDQMVRFGCQLAHAAQREPRLVLQLIVVCALMQARMTPEQVALNTPALSRI